MEKMIVIAFDTESKAYEGAKALRELHDEGSLTVYAAAVITKDRTGAVSVKQEADIGPAGTALGLATGSLIGLLGGPAGLAIGAATGGIAGSVYDMAQAGVGEDFIDDVSEYLSPGKAAVVAHVEETWVTPLDTRMEALGGVVFRRARGEFIDAQIEQNLAANKAEIEELEAERDQATGEAKAKLRAKLDAAQKRLQVQSDSIKEKIDNINREGDAKIKKMQEQAARTKGEKKAKLEKRIAEVRADYKARTDKLNKARQLFKEAVTI